LNARLDELFGKFNAPVQLDEKAKEEWYDYIRIDAQKEYDLGDVDKEVLDAFLAKLK